jgi:hypothetical protein
VVEQQLVHGLTMTQRRELVPRNSRNKSAEEQWNYMYRICFPNDTVVPNGLYVHYSHDVASMYWGIMEILSRYRSGELSPERDRNLVQELDTYLISQQWQVAGQPLSLLAGLLPSASPQMRFLSDPDSSWSGMERHDPQQTNDINALGSDRPPIRPSVSSIAMNNIDAVSSHIVTHIDGFNRNANGTTPPQDAGIGAVSNTQNSVGLHAGSQNMEIPMVIPPSPEGIVEATDPNYWDIVRRYVEEAQYPNG